MPAIFNLSTTAYLTGLIFSLLTTGVLWKYTNADNKANRLLAAYFFTCFLGNFIVYLVYSGLMQYAPWYHFFRTGNIAGLLIMPISFLYFRQVLGNRSFIWKDIFHFLPAFLYAIDYLPVFLLSSKDKMQMAALEMARPDRGQSIFHGWMVPTINWVLLRTTLIAIYWLLEVRLLYRAAKAKGGNHLLHKNAYLFGWLVFSCLAQSLYFLPFIINILLGRDTYNFEIIHTSISLAVFLQMVFLLFKPGILYGLKGLVVVHQGPQIIPVAINQPIEASLQSMQKAANEDEEQAKASGITRAKTLEYLPETRVKQIAASIEKAFIKKEAFLRRNYSMRELSIATGIQPYLLSAVFNEVYKMHFNDFTNKHRVLHARKLIKSGDYNNLTLEALAEQCGFNNRNSFTTAFKKYTGQTPSAFLQSLGN